jgi:hypothetical protein
MDMDTEPEPEEQLLLQASQLVKASSVLMSAL